MTAFKPRSSQAEQSRERQESTPCSHSKSVETTDRCRPEPTAQLDPLQTFITTPAAGRVGCDADIRTGLLHVGGHRSRDGAELLWNTPVELLICNYSPLCGNRRLSQFVEQRLGFF